MSKLGELCDILNGFAFQSQKYVNKGIRIIRISNVQKGYIDDSEPQYYPSETQHKISKYLLKENDLLLSLTGNVGRVALLDKDLLPAALNQRVACLRIKNKTIIDKHFLFMFLNSNHFEQKCIQSSKGIAQKNLSTEWLKEYEISLLSLEEQHKIASILDTVSETLKLRKQQLNELDLLVKSKFVEMFGDPLSNPMNWTIVKLKDLSIKITNGTTPKGGSNVYINKGISFFRSQNVWKNRLVLDDIAYIDINTHKKMSESNLKHGDILITKTGRINTENSSLGRAALFMGKDDSANINGHVYLVRLKEETNRIFILNILISNSYRNYIRKICVGGIDKRQLNKNHIEDFPIIIPPLELQNKFASFVEHVDELKSEVQKSIDQLQTLFDSLMQQYFE